MHGSGREVGTNCSGRLAANPASLEEMIGTIAAQPTVGRLVCRECAPFESADPIRGTVTRASETVEAHRSRRQLLMFSGSPAGAR